MTEYMQGLFDFMEQEHHLTLTDGELHDLIHAVESHLESEGKEVVDGERLAKMMCDIYGTCPYDQLGWEPDGGCEKVCQPTDSQAGECWKGYFQRREDN